MHKERAFPKLISEKRKAAIRQERKDFYHRPKNGIYDPITFYHILDALLERESGEWFRTGDFMKQDLHHDGMAWDVTTVGRVIADMAESLHEANGTHPIESTRRWNGQLYAISNQLEDRKAMENLLEDLSTLCQELIEQEKRGEAPKRVESPMLRCPSVAIPG